MDKTAKEICTPYLEAAGAMFERWGNTWRLVSGLPEHMGASMVLVGTDGQDSAAVDGVFTRMGEREYVLLNLRCPLVDGIEQARLPDLEKWITRANMMIPLGSLMLLEDTLVMKYGLMVDAAKPPQLEPLESGFQVFFLQRLLYTDLAAQLALEAISLEEAMARLG